MQEIKKESYFDLPQISNKVLFAGLKQINLLKMSSSALANER